jgi:uncharacterized membrane protein YfcA
MDWVWIVTFLIILTAAMIQAGTGFGFAIIAIPLLVLLHDAHTAVPLANLLSLVSAVALLPQARKEVDKSLLKPLFVGSLAGLPLGGVFFYFIPVFWLKVTVSATIVIFTLLLIRKVSLPLGNGKRIGAVSGFFTTSLGMPGPPIVLYLASKNTDKASFRGTTIVFYSLVYPISLLIQAGTGHLTLDLVEKSIFMIPAIVIGQMLGSLIHNKLNQQTFRKVTYVLLMVSAFNSLWQAF